MMKPCILTPPAANPNLEGKISTPDLKLGMEPEADA
jgi:hypothetical protein